jgi:nicotinate dehydrogenase subunit A
METSYKLRVNGREQVVSVAAEPRLLYVLGNDLALNGPKFGCGLAQCGAGAVLRDGREIRSCVTPVAAAVDSNITTSEGLGTPDCLHPPQTGFVERQAAQCEYCTCVIAAVDLLRSNPGHLCRYRSHVCIIDATVQAARAEVPI